MRDGAAPVLVLLAGSYSDRQSTKYGEFPNYFSLRIECFRSLNPPDYTADCYILHHIAAKGRIVILFCAAIVPN